MTRTYITLKLGREGCIETTGRGYGGLAMGIRQVVVTWGLVMAFAGAYVQAREARLATAPRFICD